MRAPVFYGWWMVAACLVVAIVAWGLGLFGSSVYLHAVTEAKGWSIGLVSSAITLYYLVSARSLIVVGSVPRFTRVGALRTTALRSVIVTFGLGLMIQIGFLTHHVALVAPSLGAGGASATVSATALMAFLGRLALARFADHIDVRLTTGAVLLLAAAVLSALALFPVPAVLVGASAVYGLTVGNVTTLSPIIVRREFGAAAFGAVYGAAATGIQLISALGPTFFGVLRDLFGGYGPPLLIAAALDVVAAAVVVLGGRTPPAAPYTPGPLTSPAEAG